MMLTKIQRDAALFRESMEASSNDYLLHPPLMRTGVARANVFIGTCPAKLDLLLRETLGHEARQ